MFKSKKPPFILKLYFFVTKYFGPFLSLVLQYRLLKGKEDKKRILERKGISKLERPLGSLVWFNAASVGEALSILNLIEDLGKKNKKLKFLITTTTITSSKILKESMPTNCIHQFSPIDTLSATTNFLNHWKPNLAIFVESEFWPRLIFEIKKQQIPLGLINARMEKKTFENWLKIKTTSMQILNKFDFVYSNDHLTAKRLQSLGIEKKILFGISSLKEQAPPLTYSKNEYYRFKNLLKDKIVWVAASTHEGEEELVVEAQQILHEIDKNYLLILVPRHPNRSELILKNTAFYSTFTKTRSKNQKIAKDTSIYLADTLGELGLWFMLSKIVFLGGSLVNIGGHNPYEPCRFGCAIITGAYVHNFKKAFDQLSEKNAVKYVKSVEELVETIKILSNHSKANNMGQRGLKYVNSLNDETFRIASTINTFL